MTKVTIDRELLERVVEYYADGEDDLKCIAQACREALTHPAPAEQVEVRGLQWLDTGHYRKKPPKYGYNPHDWNELMTVAQHNRIMAASVPAGCKVVPVEPTEAMRRAAQDKLADEGFMVTDWLVHAIYSAMLANDEWVKA